MGNCFLFIIKNKKTKKQNDRIEMTERQYLIPLTTDRQTKNEYIYILRVNVLFVFSSRSLALFKRILA